MLLSLCLKLQPDVGAHSLCLIPFERPTFSSRYEVTRNGVALVYCNSHRTVMWRIYACATVGDKLAKLYLCPQIQNKTEPPNAVTAQAAPTRTSALASYSSARSLWDAKASRSLPSMRWIFIPFSLSSYPIYHHPWRSNNNKPSPAIVVVHHTGAGYQFHYILRQQQSGSFALHPQAPPPEFFSQFSLLRSSFSKSQQSGYSLSGDYGYHPGRVETRSQQIIDDSSYAC